MAAEGALAEMLARVEYKLDLLLDYIALTNSAVWLKLLEDNPFGGLRQVCPVCTQPVQYQPDIVNKVIARKCGCATGKQPPIDLAAFAAPTTQSVETTHGRGSEEQEDRSNPPPGRSTWRKR